MAKKEDAAKVPEAVDSVEALYKKLAAIREAQKEFVSYSQNTSIMRIKIQRHVELLKKTMYSAL